MDQGESQIKGIKCSKHKCQPLDLIDLTGSSETGRICLLCFQQMKLPHEHFLSISELFEQEEGQILSSYPPFKNQKIRELIQQYCEKSIQKSDVDSFFRKLRQDIEVAIQSIENKAKQQIIKNESQKKILIEELNRISETDKLKQLLVQGSKSLNAFLQEKWKNSSLNEKFIQQVIDQIEENTSLINFMQKKSETNYLIQCLQEFTLFEQKKQKIISLDANLIKSTVGASKSLTITKTQKNVLQFMNDSEFHQFGTAFLDFVLNPQKRYIIKLNYQPKSYCNTFLFGIFKDSSKEIKYGNGDQMCYSNDTSDNYGINKQITGTEKENKDLKKKKQEFEVRISLQEKILRVISLSLDESSETIVELDDKNKIESVTPYRFFVSLLSIGDMIEITDIFEKNKYENEEF